MQKLVLVLLISFMFLNKLNAQIVEGVYESTDIYSDLFCLKKDTILFKVFNKSSAFSQYNVYLGSYRSKTNKIVSEENLLGHEAFLLKENSGEEKIIEFKLLYFNSEPMEFANVVLTDVGKEKNKIYKNSDANGVIRFEKEELSSLSGASMKVTILMLDFQAYCIIPLTFGKSYTVQSKISTEKTPFILSRFKKVFHLNEDTKHLETTSFYGRSEIIFKRVGDCESCRDLLFREE